MAPVSPLSSAHLQAISDVIGDTETGLTGTEIGQLLARCNIADPLPGITKRRRLYEALSQRQAQDRVANHIMGFIMVVMDPVRWAGRQPAFEHMRCGLNEVMAFGGYTVGEDGKIRLVAAAKTLSEAEGRAGRLRFEMERREVHPDVLRFCRAELLQENYFHAVFEVTKSVAQKIRDRTGLTVDGSELVDQTFGLGKAGIPLLAFNSLRTETERSEHTGLMNLLKGMFSAFRNVTAHAPKIHWVISEQDAKDMLSLASLLHRRIDDAVRTHRHP